MWKHLYIQTRSASPLPPLQIRLSFSRLPPPTLGDGLNWALSERSLSFLRTSPRRPPRSAFTLPSLKHQCHVPVTSRGSSTPRQVNRSLFWTCSPNQDQAAGKLQVWPHNILSLQTRLTSYSCRAGNIPKVKPQLCSRNKRCPTHQCSE